MRVTAESAIKLLIETLITESQKVIIKSWEAIGSVQPREESFSFQLFGTTKRYGFTVNFKIFGPGVNKLVKETFPEKLPSLPRSTDK